MRKIIDNHKNIINYIQEQAKQEEKTLKKYHKLVLSKLTQENSSLLEKEKNILKEQYDKKLLEKIAQLESSFSLKKKDLILDFENEIIKAFFEELKKEFEKEFEKEANLELVNKIISKLQEQARLDGEKVVEILIPERFSLQVKIIKNIKNVKGSGKKFEICLKTANGVIYKENFQTLLEQKKKEILALIREELLKEFN